MITTKEPKLHEGKARPLFGYLRLRGPKFPMLESNSSPLMPDNPRQKAEDHYYAALDFFSEGQHEHALDEYRKAMEADPTFTEALHGMARALQDLNRLDEAIEVSKRITEID